MTGPWEIHKDRLEHMSHIIASLCSPATTCELQMCTSPLTGTKKRQERGWGNRETERERERERWRERGGDRQTERERQRERMGVVSRKKAQKHLHLVCFYTISPAYNSSHSSVFRVPLFKRISISC